MQKHNQYAFATQIIIFSEKYKKNIVKTPIFQMTVQNLFSEWFSLYDLVGHLVKKHWITRQFLKNY
jgi:hypothetical protein